MNYRRCTLLAAGIVAALSTRARADDAASHADRAQTLYNVGKFGEAAAELETAYELDPSNTRILFNLAQAYHMAGNLERAAFVLRRYLEDPRADEKAEAQRRLAEIEAELKVTAEKGAAAKVTDDELARTKAALDTTKAALATAQARLAALETPTPERMHVSFEYGSTVLYVVGAHTYTATNHGRVRWMWPFRHAPLTLEQGVVWSLMPIPYAAADGTGASALFSTITYDIAAHGDLSARWWVGGELGVGFGGFGHLKMGNPFGDSGKELADTGSLVARADLMFGFRWNRTVSTVASMAVTTSTTPDGFRAGLSGPLAWDALGLALHVFF